MVLYTGDEETTKLILLASGKSSTIPPISSSLNEILTPQDDVDC